MKKFLFVVPFVLSSNCFGMGDEISERYSDAYHELTYAVGSARLLYKQNYSTKEFSAGKAINGVEGVIKKYKGIVCDSMKFDILFRFGNIDRPRNKEEWIKNFYTVMNKVLFGDKNKSSWYRIDGAYN